MSNSSLPNTLNPLLFVNLHNNCSKDITFQDFGTVNWQWIKPKRDPKRVLYITCTR